MYIKWWFFKKDMSLGVCNFLFCSLWYQNPKYMYFSKIINVTYKVQNVLKIVYALNYNGFYA